MVTGWGHDCGDGPFAYVPVTASDYGGGGGGTTVATVTLVVVSPAVRTWTLEVQRRLLTRGVV